MTPFFKGLHKGITGRGQIPRLQRAAPLYITASLSSRKYSVVFFGTDEVSLPTLSRLHELQASNSPVVQSLRVVCPGDRPMGRGRVAAQVPVKKFAAEHGIPTHEVPYGM